MVRWNFLLVLIAYLAAVIAHELGDGIGRYAECGSGKINWPIRYGNVGPMSRAKRQSPQPIRILPYYVTANISSDETLNVLQAEDGPVEYTLDYFRRTLSVIPFQQNIRAPSNSMCGPHVAVPDDHTEPSGAGVNADYLYYITAVNDEVCRGGFIVAYAGPCFIAHLIDNRPYIGYVNYCPTIFTRYNSDFINTLSLHETTHALVFLPSLFQLFPSNDNVLSQQRIDGQDVPIITTPKVVQAARDHYNCSTLAGPLLENEGGELSIGTHWESRTLFPELMNGLIYDTLARKSVISRMTLSLFEDSGWYTVNYEAGLTGELLWGYDEGCGFVTANCNSTSYPYACSPCCFQKIECAYDYQSAGYCRQATFFDDCAVVIPARFCNDTVSTNINIDLPQGSIADYGPQSICVASSTTNDANCVAHRCVQIQGTELMAFSLTVNDQTEWCYPNGSVNNGGLECPPIRYACASSNIDMLSPTDDPIPPPLCDTNCGSCSIAQNPAFCTTCAAGRLNGLPPSSCLSSNNPCTGNTYLSSGEGCVACPTGCSLCTGPLNSECLACEDTNLYRDTTDRLRNPCVIRCGLGMIESIDVFGVRTCVDVDRRDSGAMRALTGVSSTVVMLIFIAAVMMDI